MDMILPFITLIAGTFLGLLASVSVAYLQQKQEINNKIIEQYFAAREQLCDHLSTLANLQVASSCKLEPTVLTQHQEVLSKLFYKYYDFLPPEVLKEMLCLHACLSDKENRLYKHENNCLFLIEDKDVEKFVDRVSLINNFKYYAPITLRSKDPNLRRVASVNYQARGVLVSINRYFTIQHLISWNRYLQKSKETKSKFHSTSLNNRALPHIGPIQQKVVTCNKDAIEDQLALILASVFQLNTVEPDDNFFDLGGDSILAIEITHRIIQQFGIQIPLLTIFECPTLRTLTPKVMQFISDQLEGSR